MARAEERDAQTIKLPGGGTVSFAEYGDAGGAPVLALHGAPASRLMFALADQAARRLELRLLAPDRPGYGFTPADGRPSLASRAAWLSRVADALGLERFAILAISGGAPYGVALASRLGERVSALALISPMGPVADYMATEAAGNHPLGLLHRCFFLSLPRREWLIGSLAGLARRLFLAAPARFGGAFARALSGADAQLLARPHVRDALVAVTREGLRSGPRGGILDLSIYAAPWGVDYRAITAPAIVWQGLADRIVPMPSALHLASLIPRCRLVELDGAGHFWVLDHVEEVLSELSKLMHP